MAMPRDLDTEDDSLAEEILASRLSEVERAKVLEIYRDISHQIRWGKVIAEFFPTLLDNIQDVIFGLNGFKSPAGRYTKTDPWKALGADQSLFDEGDDKAMSRRHLLMLLLVKKLLGALKSKTKLELAEIPVLSAAEETRLLEVVQVRREAEEEAGMARHLGVVARLERERIELAPEGDCRQDGRHVRTEIRFHRKNEEVYSEQYCKDCRQVIRRVSVRSPLDKSRPCDHPGAEWVEGLEGKDAVCSRCKEPIPNPETYRWEEVGLEPVGDDPTADETVVLCSAY